jgi:hypothetical protein
MRLLDFCLSAPVHPNNVNPMNVISRQWPHRGHVRSVPSCFPTVQNDFDLCTCAVGDCDHWLHSGGCDHDAQAIKSARFEPRFTRCVRRSATSHDLPGCRPDRHGRSTPINGWSDDGPCTVTSCQSCRTPRSPELGGNGSITGRSILWTHRLYPGEHLGSGRAACAVLGLCATLKFFDRVLSESGHRRSS